MIYFCADDYGISAESNSRIENCIKNGVLNKISVLPNGEIDTFKKCLEYGNVVAALHLNLVEGKPLSNEDDVSLIISDRGYFKYSFIGLMMLSLSPKRKEIGKQIYQEIKSQLRFWKEQMGDKAPLYIDSHQHTHMIPLVFKTLMRAIEDEGVNVSYLRIPAEPLKPYIFSPKLYFEYSLTGLIKQWLLKFFAFINRKELKKAKIESAYFMGVMFSGKLNETRIKKLLTQYLKLAEKNNKNIEIGFHPGYLENDANMIKGKREGFSKFYFSPWRKIEHDTLINFKF